MPSASRAPRTGWTRCPATWRRGCPRLRPIPFIVARRDSLNLLNLLTVSQVIVRAVRARENSRDAHCRADFLEPGDLDTSTYTCIRARANQLDVEAVPVRLPRAVRRVAHLEVVRFRANPFIGGAEER